MIMYGAVKTLEIKIIIRPPFLENMVVHQFIYIGNCRISLLD